MSSEDDGWLPRLADGVPIWKLAQDLNQPDLMDGALIVPETEGSPSAPRVIRWHVRNLMPLDAARDTHPAEYERALAAFRDATARMEIALDNPKSAYHTFRSAFSLPSLDQTHYFFDPVTCKLHVIHWGAEPRSHGARGETVYGFGNLGELFIAAPKGAAGTPLVSPMTATSTTLERGAVAGRSPWWWGLLVPLVAGAAWYAFVVNRSQTQLRPLDAGAVTIATAAPSATVTVVKSHHGHETLVPFDKPLLFEFGSARIDADGDATVRRAAAYLKAHPEIVRVRIEGHADSTGEDDKNFVLSTARALAVRRALIAAGVDGENLHVDAHGQSKPTVLDAGASLQNRRVELWGFRDATERQGSP